MWMTLLLKILTSDMVEGLIAKGINYLLESKTAGIGKDLATTMIEGVAKSKANPTTEEVFSDALLLLK